MEVESCKVVDSFYCIWFEKGLFHIDDVYLRKILRVTKHQLKWFIDSLSDLVQGLERKFFLKNGNDGNGASKLTKF